MGKMGAWTRSMIAAGQGPAARTDRQGLVMDGSHALATQDHLAPVADRTLPTACHPAGRRHGSTGGAKLTPLAVPADPTVIQMTFPQVDRGATFV